MAVISRSVVPALVAGCLMVVASACGPSSAENAGSSSVLSASQVGGKLTGSGTDLLQPAAKSCDVDGEFMWENATNEDVRSFERTVDGHTEKTVVGAWKMPKQAALQALDKTAAGPKCNTGTWTAESQSVGAQPPAHSFEVRKRDASGAWCPGGYVPTPTLTAT